MISWNWKQCRIQFFVQISGIRNSFIFKFKWFYAHSHSGANTLDSLQILGPRANPRVSKRAFQFLCVLTGALATHHAWRAIDRDALIYCCNTCNRFSECRHGVRVWWPRTKGTASNERVHSHTGDRKKYSRRELVKHLWNQNSNLCPLIFIPCPDPTESSWVALVGVLLVNQQRVTMPTVKGDGMRGLAVFISDIRNCEYDINIALYWTVVGKISLTW